jgi:hypothetical protein
MLKNTTKVGQKRVAMTVGWKTPLKELLVGRVEVPSEKTRHEALLVDVLHANMRWETVDQTIEESDKLSIGRLDRWLHRR